MSQNLSPPCPELLGLLSEAKLRPDDDAPRLVLADWLEEHGEHERGEFVRLEVAQTAMPPWAPACLRAREQAFAIRKRHAAVWEDPFQVFRIERPFDDPEKLPQDWRDRGHVIGSGVGYRRGLLELNFAPWYMDNLVNAPWESLARTEAVAWVDGLVITGVQSRHAGGLAALPLLDTVSRLHVDTALGGDPGAHFQALAGRAWRGNVVGFGLYGNARDGWRGLPELGFWPGVRRFEVGGPSLEPGRKAELLQLLAECPHLESLNVGVRHLHPVGPLRDLARGDGLRRLRHLRLYNAQLTAEQLADLAAGFPGLQSLALPSNPLKNPDIDSLATSPERPGLAELDLSVNHFTGGAVEVLMKAPIVRHLQQLNLSRNRVGAIGATALAQSPHAAGLTVLNLGDCKIGDKGAKILLGSEFLVGLQYLNLRGNGISPGVQSPLRDRFGDGVAL